MTPLLNGSETKVLQSKFILIKLIVLKVVYIFNISEDSAYCSTFLVKLGKDGPFLFQFFDFILDILF
jgi:predicted choloylglycine hydrolase